MIRLLRTFLRPYRWQLLVVLVLQIIQASASLYLPSLNADIIDNGVLAGDTGFIWTTGAVMLGITVVQAVFAIAAVYLGARVAMGVARDLRRALFHRVTDFSAREVNVFGAPSLINRVTNDVQQVQVFVVSTCTAAMATPITMVGGIAMALREDAGLAWILAVSLPVLMFALALVVAKMIPLFQVMQRRLDTINRVLREQITGMRVVRAFVREPEETRRFAKANDELSATSLVAGRLQGLTVPILLLVVNASSIAVLWFGANRVADGTSQVGSLVAFLTYLNLIMVAVLMATYVVMQAPRAAVCAVRIRSVLDTDSSVTAANEPVRDLRDRGSLELRDVGFHYPGAEHAVLAGISFTSRAGETTAIIGSTGSGKTTLVNVIARLVDVTAGAVVMDGVDLRDLDPEILWSRIGLVPQKPYLFSGTVASNLRDGKPDATDEELWEALRVAQAADFVATMPGGLDTPIAQGGSNVSGGQRQRLAIARALVRKPEIYLFDDSFSALDLATDAKLRAELGPHTRDASVVIVAQRVSTIADADQILVLEDGECVGLGTYDDLVDTCPTFAEIVASQTQAAAA